MKKLACVLSLVVLFGVVSTASAALYVLPVVGNDSDNVAAAHMVAGQTYAQWDAAKPGFAEAGGNATTAYIDIYVKVDGPEAAASWAGGAYNFTVTGGTPSDLAMFNFPDEIGTNMAYANGLYTDADSWVAAEYGLGLGAFPLVVLGANNATLAGAASLNVPPYPNVAPANWVHFGRIGLSGVAAGVVPGIPLGCWDPINGGPGGAVWDAANAAAGEQSPSQICVVPEPASLLLLLAGVVGLIRRKK